METCGLLHHKPTCLFYADCILKHTVCVLTLDPTKALSGFCFSVPPNIVPPKQPALFSPSEKSILEMEDETKLGFKCSIHFDGPYFTDYMLYFLFFLIVMTIVYPQTSLFLMDS